MKRRTDEDYPTTVFTYSDDGDVQAGEEVIEPEVEEESTEESNEESDSGTVEVKKTHGPLVVYDDTEFKNNETYAVTEEVADYLLNLKSGYGRPYFERA